MNNRLASVWAILLLVFTVLAGCAAPAAPAATPTPAATPAAPAAPAATPTPAFIEVGVGEVTLYAEPLRLNDDQATLDLSNIQNTTDEQQTLNIRVIDESVSPPTQFGLTHIIELKKLEQTEFYSHTFTDTLVSGDTYDADFWLGNGPPPPLNESEPQAGTHCCAAKAP